MTEPDYKALARRLSDALLMVAPLGGSECFIRVGEEFYADPDFFKQRIQQIHLRTHEAMKRAALAERAVAVRTPGD